jgi:hypothetical protein
MTPDQLLNIMINIIYDETFTRIMGILAGITSIWEICPYQESKAHIAPLLKIMGMCLGFLYGYRYLYKKRSHSRLLTITVPTVLGLVVMAFYMSLRPEPLFLIFLTICVPPLLDYLTKK